MRSIVPCLDPESRSLIPDWMIDVAPAPLRKASMLSGDEDFQNTAIASVDEEEKYTCIHALTEPSKNDLGCVSV